MVNHINDAAYAFSNANKQGPDSMSRLNYLAAANYHATMAVAESNQQILEALRRRV